MSTNPTDRIAERRRFIAQRTEELQAELETLTAEGIELDIAERVLQRYSTPPSVGGTVYRATPQEVEGAPDPEPEMTLPAMVFKILGEAKDEGRKGVDSSEITATIRRRWKPDFTPDNVRPTLWRMVKGQRLKKRGKLYSLPVVSPEGETEAVGASVRH